MPNPVVHFEVSSADGEKAQKFYGDLFGWHIDANNPMNYGMVEPPLVRPLVSRDRSCPSGLRANTLPVPCDLSAESGSLCHERPGRLAHLLHEHRQAGGNPLDL